MWNGESENMWELREAEGKSLFAIDSSLPVEDLRSSLGT
jgi:hypothetical protein